MQRGQRAAGLLLALAAAGEAGAQTLDPQHFHPAATLTGLAGVKGAAAEGSFVPTLALISVYARDPLVLVDHNGERAGSLVGDRVDLVLSYAMGLDTAQLEGLAFIRGIDIAAVVPFVPYQTQDATLEQGHVTFESTRGGGIADPRLEARVSFGTPGFNLAFIPVLSLPTSTGAGFLGNGTVMFTPELAASVERGPVLVAANVGYRVRENKIAGGVPVGDQWLWRTGLGVELAGPTLFGSIEAYGLTPSDRPFESTRDSPTEILGALRARVFDAVLNLGAGTGLNSGYGTPRLRVVAGAAWAPRTFDADADGISDAADACPESPEDLDGFEDPNGCPDPDNDSDRFLDDNDACPDEPEDLDRYKDDDGCPDPDNDADRVLDLDDGCSDEPEDHDGFADSDGCPDLDNDADSVPDPRDRCPDYAEDADGFADADGCPDLDNDEDGILDLSDQCPDKPEDKNGLRDEDGCPDGRDDKDGDGIGDLADKCRNEPEDKDGFEDDDGCPELDNDADGITDAGDACPAEKEDLDEFMDDDGCPEDDNDGDGIWDRADTCPSQSEVINGVNDEDGCPDEGAQLVRLTPDRIEITEKVDGRAIRRYKRRLEG